MINLATDTRRQAWGSAPCDESSRGEILYAQMMRVAMDRISPHYLFEAAAEVTVALTHGVPGGDPYAEVGDEWWWRIDWLMAWEPRRSLAEIETRNVRPAKRYHYLAHFKVYPESIQWTVYIITKEY